MLFSLGISITIGTRVSPYKEMLRTRIFSLRLSESISVYLYSSWWHVHPSHIGESLTDSRGLLTRLSGIPKYVT
jgi:hypothetical protein